MRKTYYKILNYHEEYYYIDCHTEFVNSISNKGWMGVTN